jgi:hypothetical protein
MLTAVETDKIAPRKREGWIMPTEVEDYLDKFDGVGRLADRAFAMGERIAETAETLKDHPRGALPSISSDWPTYQQIRELIEAYEKAQNELDVMWPRLPEKIREAMPNKHPSQAGRRGMRDG